MEVIKKFNFILREKIEQLNKYNKLMAFLIIIKIPSVAIIDKLCNELIQSLRNILDIKN